MPERSEVYFWATDGDRMWLAETQKNKDHLDSKDFEGMIYAQFIPQIEKIVQEELGFKPDMRRNSLMEVESFKTYQKYCADLLKSGKEKDTKGRTIQDLLATMRHDVTAGILNPVYNLEGWEAFDKRLMEKHNTDEEGMKVFMFPILDRLRDRIAAEIPLL